MAKAPLPEFGGSAGVWVACMLFFQVMLLMGYLYSYLIAMRVSRGSQGLLHAALLLLSLTTISLRPRLGWMDPAVGHPALSILGVLLVSVGLPYFLLSTTSPLLQSWFAESVPMAFPYWLFALSNAASLLALLAYPVVIEPVLPQSVQLRWWWMAYAALVVTRLRGRGETLVWKFGQETPQSPKANRAVHCCGSCSPRAHPHYGWRSPVT
jgi:hypothetical protein